MRKHERDDGPEIKRTRRRKETNREKDTESGPKLYFSDTQRRRRRKLLKNHATKKGEAGAAVKNKNKKSSPSFEEKRGSREKRVLSFLCQKFHFYFLEK